METMMTYKMEIFGSANENIKNAQERMIMQKAKGTHCKL